jgi:uncharacterized membrane protein
MISKHPTFWSRIQLVAVGLMLLGAFGPLSDPWHQIVSGVGVALFAVWLYVISREERRERQADQSSSSASAIRRLVDSWILLPALALVLLSLGTLTPISDLWDKVFSWIAVAVFLVHVGVAMWEFHRARQADQSSSAAISLSDQM